MRPGYRLAVRVLAWALRRGVTIEQAAASVGRAYAWRDEAWRDQLMLDALGRNRERVMRSLGA